MDDADAMRGAQGVANLDRDGQRLVEPQRPALEAIVQRFAVEQFHDQVVDGLVAADVMDGADMRVVERRNRPRFLLEALPRLGVGRARAGDDLDGDRAIEPRVPRFVDLAHAARAERGEDLVDAESRTGRKAQGGEL
jgi:hypothetical protein